MLNDHNIIKLKINLNTTEFKSKSRITTVYSCDCGNAHGTLGKHWTSCEVEVNVKLDQSDISATWNNVNGLE